MCNYESEEMHLKTILLLEEKLQNVRRVDIAAEFGYSKASVTNAIKRLRVKGYICIDQGAPDAMYRVIITRKDKRHVSDQQLYQ